MEENAVSKALICFPQPWWRPDEPFSCRKWIGFSGHQGFSFACPGAPGTPETVTAADRSLAGSRRPLPYPEQEIRQWLVYPHLRRLSPPLS